MAGESINIESVVRRFDDSTRALSDLQATIETLGTSQATQQRAADSIEDAASRLLEFTSQLGEVCEKVSEANAAAVEALGAAEKFLEGTDLSQMKSQVLELSGQAARIVELLEGSLQEARQTASAAESAREDANSELQALQAKIEEADQAASSAQRAKESTESELQALKAKVADLPERARRKFGL